MNEETHNALVDEAKRRAKATVLPPEPPLGQTVSNEREVISAFDLPDEHCEVCHEGTSKSCVAVGNRLIEVCCAVTDNFKAKQRVL